MNQLTLLEVPPKRRTSGLLFNPKEYKIQTMRECPTPAEMQLCETPDKAAAYWWSHVVSHPYFAPDVETLVVVLLNTRRRVQGHHLVSNGILDTLLVHPRECLRAAVISAAAAFILMHNHPSGDPTPSEADIKVTRDIFRAGQLMRIELLDHVIIGKPSSEQRGWVSLRELGYLN
jgi:DNA repair protein RadC